MNSANEFSQNIATPSSNILQGPFYRLQTMGESLKSVLRGNVARLMDKNPDVDSPTRLARRCFWPRGDRKGKQIAPRSLGYIFENNDNSPSPTLDLVEAIATALGVRPWELLITGADRDELMRRIFGPAAADSRVAEFIAPAPPMIHQERKRYDDREVKPSKARKFKR